MELNKLFISISKGLNRFKIPYIVIGGQAVLIYSDYRATNDIDIVVGIDISDVDKLINCIKYLKLEIKISDIQNFVRKSWVLPAFHKETGYKIDFIFSITDYERQAIQRGKDFKFGNSKIKFCSLEDIIIHKLFAGREIDLNDVKKMILKYNKHDKKYIRKWLKVFDKSSETNLLKTYNGLLKKV